MGQHFNERKKKAGVGGREFKNTTNINREKKERKEVLDFFFFLLGKACETKRALHFSVLVY